MLLSVPFIVATILVYLCIPELRNVHGKCLVCYLTGLAIGYSVLACVQLNGNEPVPELLCKSAGYIIYFAFSAAFLWLSAISFDLWWTLGYFTYERKHCLFTHAIIIILIVSKGVGEAATNCRKGVSFLFISCTHGVWHCFSHYSHIYWTTTPIL